MNSISGKLIHEISILANMAISELDDEDWQEKTKTFAEIKPLYDNKFGSLENFSFGHIVTENFFMFKIRYLPDLNTKLRIRFDERIFEIKRIINLNEKNIFLQIIGLEL
jgi:SPP1 family predicted phage head-tail adaptor